jgi:preprotein translocase subunit SecY
MASAAEQLFANLNFAAFSKATELKQRIWFTLGALIIYRLGTFIPIPGVDLVQYEQTFQKAQGGFLGMFNMFSGGAVERLAIFTLGIMPYISTSIILQLLTSVVPALEAIKKDGEAGRKKINQYTRYGTVGLCTLQAYGTALGLESQNLAVSPGWFFQATTVITLAGGTMFLMWLGEQITARGVGNGISLIIFAGIVASIPASYFGLMELSSKAAINPLWVPGILVLGALIIAVIVYFERAQRRLLVQYPKRQQGNKMFSGDSSHLPLKLNTAGVIPPIFASSLLLLPASLANFETKSFGAGWEWLNTINAWLARGSVVHELLYMALIIFFCFFYTAVVFNTKETAENLKKYGGFIQGIRPGERTAQYLDYVLSRITVAGAIYIALVCVLPEILTTNVGIPIYLGGTSLLIAVSVTMDTIAQVQSHLLAHQYEGLIKKSKLRGGGISPIGRKR